MADTPPEQYIQPIPTTYNRINFRSRLEARWAVFFDLLGIKYEYEPEKYFTGMSRYIPDFRVSRFCSANDYDFIEIKGKPPDIVDLERASIVNAVVFSGSLLDHLIVKPLKGTQGELTELPLYLRQCPFCETIGLARLGTDGHSRQLWSLNDLGCEAIAQIGDKFELSPGWELRLPLSDKPITFSPIVQVALEKAQNARFEDPNLYERLQDFRSTLARFSDLGASGSTLHVMGLFFWAADQRSKKHNDASMGTSA